jgi:hypothetical protein
MNAGLLHAVADLMNRPPIHVEHLDVQRLEFNFESIDVSGLGGEMNIGFTNSLKAGDKQKQPSRQEEVKSRIKKELQPAVSHVVEQLKNKLDPLRRSLQQKLRSRLDELYQGARPSLEALAESSSAQLKRHMEEQLDRKLEQQLKHQLTHQVERLVEQRLNDLVQPGADDQSHQAILEQVRTYLEQDVSQAVLALEAAIAQETYPQVLQRLVRLFQKQLAEQPAQTGPEAETPPETRIIWPPEPERRQRGG